MILIADSGSSKCAWKLVFSRGDIQTFYSTGINPFFRSSESIYEELIISLYPLTSEPVEKIFFYGTGIINEDKAGVIRFALAQMYPNAIIELYSDILAASRSLFSNKQGIACILGTGSNVCLFNGKSVETGISPLGFILGDEGSGAVLGKKLLGDFFKEVMPLPLRERFEAKYHLSREEALQRVYKSEKPNFFLASFAPFLSEEIADDYSVQLVRNSLIEFFDRNVTKIPDYSTYSIGFVGSVAFHFSGIVKEVCALYQLNCKSIQKEPMDGLIDYHMNVNLLADNQNG